VVAHYLGGRSPEGPLKSQVAGLVIGVYFASTICRTQGLAPRAYVITPTGSNAVTLTYTFSDGTVLFEGAVPIADFGHSAHITASEPFGVGNFSGKWPGRRNRFTALAWRMATSVSP
jgi:hypothetical protein